MKIGYDSSGNIVAVASNSIALRAPNVIELPDNSDCMANPQNYRIVGGALSSKRFILLTPSASSASRGSNIVINVAVYSRPGMIDMAGADTVAISTQGITTSGFVSPVVLSGGEANFNVTSSEAGNVLITGISGATLVCPAAISFV